jgi:hypothetical protein
LGIISVILNKWKGRCKVYHSIAMAKIKDIIYSKGYATVRALSILFKHCDSDDKNRKLTKDEFSNGMKSFGINLTKAELDVLSKLEYWKPTRH